MAKKAKVKMIGRKRSQTRRDRKLFSRAWEGRNWRIIVSVHTYEGGSPKLQLTREKTSKKYEHNPFAKLGRLSREEMDGIMPLMQEAMTHMGNAPKKVQTPQRHRIKKDSKENS